MKTLSLRNLEDEDLVMVEGWLKQDFIAEWLGGPSSWMRELENRKGEFSFVRHFIALHKGEPLGFCQYYDCTKVEPDSGLFSEKAGVYGIDYFVAQRSLLGKGLGKKIVRLICDKVKAAEDDTIQIIADPSVEEGRENVASIKSLLANDFAYEPLTSLFVKNV